MVGGGFFLLGSILIPKKKSCESKKKKKDLAFSACWTKLREDNVLSAALQDLIMMVKSVIMKG